MNGIIFGGQVDHEMIHYKQQKTIGDFPYYIAVCIPSVTSVVVFTVIHHTIDKRLSFVHKYFNLPWEYNSSYIRVK